MNCQNLWLEASRLALVNSAKGTMQKIREFLKVPELLASVAEGLQASFRQFYMCLTCLISQMECYEVYLKYVISEVSFSSVFYTYLISEVSYYDVSLIFLISDASFYWVL